MTTDQGLILAILGLAAAMFAWGRWRHDMVAGGALLACVAAGLTSPEQAFSGFGHPAVITVACVLVLSRALQTSGAVDLASQRFLGLVRGQTSSIATLIALAAVMSAFMNNVGALALLMPMGIQIAAREGLPPGRVLMPLAFGSILGGMTTLIGTPPNLIVANFRRTEEAGAFGMFDFTPVGLAVAVSGLIFVAAVGWRLVPDRKRAGAEDFETGSYLTEARIPEDAKAAGMSLREIEDALEKADVQVIGLVRNEVRLSNPSMSRATVAGDILLLEADPSTLGAALSSLGLELEEDVRGDDEAEEDERSEDDAAAENGDDGDEKERDGDEGSDADAESEEDRRSSAPPSEGVALVEMVVLPDSAMGGRSASDIRLRTLHGVNLLAISRQGRQSISRLRATPIQPGDVLLMQGTEEALGSVASEFGCVPLAERSVRLPDRKRAMLSVGIMAAAIAMAASGLTSSSVAFAGGVLASMAAGTIPVRKVYDAVDWPVIVLLAALIPVAGAMQSTGAADLLAGGLVSGVAQGDAVLALAAILIVTMLLSDFMNNAATAAVMCPVAAGAAAGLGVATDPFLMAVAVGASCAFLTPIGHQNNTLILGPGGFRFGDYWRLGLPLEVIVTAVGVPMILLVWPL